MTPCPRLALVLAAALACLPGAATAQEAADAALAAAAQSAPVAGGPFSADGILAFARGLYAEGDYRQAADELLRWRFLEAPPPGGAAGAEIDFLVALCRLRSGEEEKAREELVALAASGAEGIWPAAARYEAAKLAARLGDDAGALGLLAAPGLPAISDAYEPGLVRGWCLILADDWAGAEESLARSASALAPELAALARKGAALPRRSPELAGLLSAIVPGAGKIYAARPLDGLFSLSMVGSIAFLSALGFRDEGLRSVKGWAYGSAALVLHLGNVYGSVVAARQFNRSGEERVEALALDFDESRLR